MSIINRELASSRIAGTGEMAELVRRFDWGKTPLGTIETWPDLLITTVNLLLASRHPMFLWWGPELIQFYNDGYRPSIRDDKHPSALGQTGLECWPEIWPIIGPQIEVVMTRGESTWNHNQLVPINRNGKLEEVYWTYSYSPVRGSSGAIQGTLVVCSESTEQVLSERRLRALLAIGESASASDPRSAAKPLASFARNLVQQLGNDAPDVPFAILYLWRDTEELKAVMTDSARPVSDPAKWPLGEAARSQTPLLVEDIPDRFGDLICAPSPEPVSRAYVMPLPLRGHQFRRLLCSASARGFLLTKVTRLSST